LASSEPIWLTEADVAALMSLPEAIECVEQALTFEARGDAPAMAKTFVAWEGGTLHALGGVIGESAIAGTKTWVHAGGAEPLLPIWDSGSGRLRGVLEAFVLGQLRTASISAIATRWLARPGAHTMAIIGTGKQAFAQVAAVAAVRRLHQVRVFSPTPAHRAAFAQRLADEGFGFEVVETASVAAAVAGADIVTTATRAREPFLVAEMLAPGAHVNAIGAITPERRELGADVVGGAGRVVADHPGDAQRLSSELSDCESVMPLSVVVADRLPRPAEETLTVFKAVGLGLADVAIAAEVLRRAQERNVGRSFAAPSRVTPRWREK